MNPLSALRLPMGPELLRAASPGLANSIPSAIPRAELDRLSPGTTLQPTGAGGTIGGSFESTLGRMVGDVSAKSAAAGDAVGGLLSGQGVPLHQAVIAMEEASVSFQLMVEVRNKLLESYQELMRMQV